MRKRVFLKKLREKLYPLDPVKVDDIIFKYSHYIDEKIVLGLKEKDAVLEMGDIDNLAKTLINEEMAKTKRKKGDIISNFTNKVICYYKDAKEVLKGKNLGQISLIIIELIVVIFLYGLLHIPIVKLCELGKDIFYILSSPLNQFFYLVWKVILEFSYLMMGVIFLGKYISLRYELGKRNMVESLELKYSDSQNKAKVFVVLIKFLAILVLFLLTIYLIGISIVLGFCVYLLFKKVIYIGIYLVMLAMFFLGILFFNLLFKFVLDYQVSVNKIFLFFIISFFLLGIGSTLAAYEVGETEFINETPDNLELDTLEEALPFSKNLVLIGNISDYVVDNSVNDIIVMYSYYPIGKRMSVEITKKEEKVNLGWNYNQIHVSKELITRMIDDLKNKKIYNYYLEPKIVIKSSEENIDILKKNRQNYYHKTSNYMTCKFTRTYYVENIKKLEKSDYAYLTLSAYGNEDIYTVKLKKSLVNDVVVGNYYEFVFETYQSYIDTSILEIFRDATVKQINKTDKKVNEQVQDNSCKVFY